MNNNMKVKELIKNLLEFDMNADVYIEDDNSVIYKDVTYGWPAPSEGGIFPRSRLAVALTRSFYTYNFYYFWLPLSFFIQWKPYSN